MKIPNFDTTLSFRAQRVYYDINQDLEIVERTFSIRVDPIEQPDPDFTILDNDFTWSPGAPVAGDEVTLTATITNLVNHSGVHSVPVVFYADDVAINLTTYL